MEDIEKQHLNIVFIGHVDSGKSSLGGAILLACNLIDERTIEKVKESAKAKGMETWWKAFFLDTNEEEQEKGKTTECGRSHFETAQKRFTILDAPGHKAYVPNMISGTAQADIAILVISARTGEFEAGFDRGGQTREHTVLAKTLGVNELIIVINKMDTVDWKRERYDEIKNTFSSFLKKTGFNPKTVKWIPISAYTGENLLEEKEIEWYQGKSLLNTLDDIEIDREDNLNKDLRIPVLDAMKDGGKIKIIGKIESGSLTINDTLMVIPSEKEFKISSIENEFDKDIQKSISGDNITITTRDLNEGEISEGDVIVKKGESKCPLVQEFLAQFKITDLPESRPVFCAGSSSILHIHTAVREVTCTKIMHSIDLKTKEKKSCNFGNKGKMMVGKFKLNSPLPLEKFEDYNQLGRFTLRDEGKTTCIGKILKIKIVK